jgi:hypothetical protein
MEEVYKNAISHNAAGMIRDWLKTKKNIEKTSNMSETGKNAHWFLTYFG